MKKEIIMRLMMAAGEKAAKVRSDFRQEGKEFPDHVFQTVFTAELCESIVRECCNQVTVNEALNIKEHFGIE